MNNRGVPMCGLKPAGTGYKIMPRSFAIHDSLSSGGGLQPALPKVIFGAEDAEDAEKA